MYNKLTCIKTFESNANLASDDGLAVYKNHIGEFWQGHSIGVDISRP